MINWPAVPRNSALSVRVDVAKPDQKYESQFSRSELWHVSVGLSFNWGSSWPTGFQGDNQNKPTEYIYHNALYGTFTIYVESIGPFFGWMMLVKKTYIQLLIVCSTARLFPGSSWCIASCTQSGWWVSGWASQSHARSCSPRWWLGRCPNQGA